MLGSEQQLDDDIIIPDFKDLEAILGEDDIIIPNFKDLKTTLDEYDITIPDFEDLKTTILDLDEGKIINQDFQNPKTTPNEIDNQNSISLAQNQPVQPKNIEPQNSIANETKSNFSDVLQQSCAVIFDNGTNDLQEDSTIQVLGNLKTGLSENKALNDLSTALYEDDIENSDLKDLEAILDETDNQSSTFLVQSQLVELQNKELQNSTIDKTEFNCREMLSKILPLACNNCSKKFKTISGIDAINSLFVIEDENSEVMQKLLNTAIIDRNSETVEKLLSSGNYVNVQNDSGDTPLHIAIRGSNLMMVKEVLEFNPNMKLRNRKGETVLHCATIKGAVGIVRLLLRYDIDVNAQDNDENTALHKATIANGNHAIFCLKALLADKRVNFSIKNKEEKCFVSIALGKLNELIRIDAKRSVHYFRLLREYYDRLSEEGKLLIQSNSGFSIIKELQAHASVLNSIKSCNSKEEIAQILLLHKIDINEKISYGNTLLHEAVKEPFSLKVIEMLLNIGADANIQNDRGNTALHVAAGRKRNSSVLGILLNCKDIDLNKQNNLGNTALHNALKSNISTNGLELLLKDSRVCLNIENKEGQCFASIILDKFKKENKVDLIELLAKHYDRLNDKSKLIVHSDSKFYYAVKKYREKFIPHNILNQSSLSSDILYQAIQMSF